MKNGFFKRKLKLGSLWLSLMLVQAGCVVFGDSPTATPQEEGQMLAAELSSAQPATNYFWSGELQVSGGTGNKFVIPVKISVILDSGSWRKEYEATVTNGGYREKLVVIRDGTQTIRYLWGRCKMGESFGALAAVPSERLFQPFAQTDFWLLDLGLDFFSWPGQKVVKREMRRSSSCRVLESAPATVLTDGYSKVISWIDIKSGGIVQAEGYDAQKKRLKVFAPKEFDKVNGHWELKEIEIRNVQTGSRTYMKFDLKKSGEMAAEK